MKIISDLMKLFNYKIAKLVLKRCKNLKDINHNYQKEEKTLI